MAESLRPHISISSYYTHNNSHCEHYHMTLSLSYDKSCRSSIRDNQNKPDRSFPIVMQTPGTSRQDFEASSLCRACHLLYLTYLQTLTAWQPDAMTGIWSPSNADIMINNTDIFTVCTTSPTKVHMRHCILINMHTYKHAYL
jgi:hypothetical protein